MKDYFLIISAINFGITFLFSGTALYIAFTSTNEALLSDFRFYALTGVSFLTAILGWKNMKAHERDLDTNYP